jgi:hypothetical protein
VTPKGKKGSCEREIKEISQLPQKRRDRYEKNSAWENKRKPHCFKKETFFSARICLS